MYISIACVSSHSFLSILYTRAFSIHIHPMNYSYSLTVELPSHRHAAILDRATATDGELRPAVVRRTSRVEGATYRLDFVSTSRTSLRTAVLSFYDFLGVSLSTMHEFHSDAAIPDE